MPWTTANVDEHKKGLTPTQKKQWVAVANSVRQSCLDGGGSETACDARAVRAANSKVGSVMATDITDITTLKAQADDLEERLLQLHARHNQKTHGRKGKGGGGSGGGVMLEGAAIKPKPGDVVQVGGYSAMAGGRVLDYFPISSVKGDSVFAGRGADRMKFPVSRLRHEKGHTREHGGRQRRVLSLAPVERK